MCYNEWDFWHARRAVRQEKAGRTLLMIERAARILEFDKVKQQLVDRAACGLGKALLADLRPFPTIEEAQGELSAVDEALQVLFRHGSLPYGGITDIRPWLNKSRIGGILAGADLAAIAHFIYGGRRVKQVIESALTALTLPNLQASANGLFDARQTEQEIHQAVDDDGTILDHASPALRKLRTERRQAEARVRQQLEQMLRTHQRYLQDPIIAMRGPSFCLPVRVEYKNQIPGIVHDYSASGATVFIEPQSAVEGQHQIRALVLDEEREVERILQRLSGVVALAADDLELNAELLATLDVWFAKASYAKAQKCERPVLRDDGIWALRRARHPLIDATVAVPIDVSLGAEHNMVVITGPNTGGKTVTLKTVGILTLLAMSGCFLTTGLPSDIGWCDEVFVDIGDEQSIEQSLSTFSSHMRTIVDTLTRVTKHSLVLLDELGAGTDPTEGAALAIAILDHLKDWGCRVVATTHYAELKAYAFREPQAVNASVEFDVETLRPTYRLLVGVPGRSNALAIASRLGLPGQIVDQARAIRSEDDVRVDDLIGEMEVARREAEAARDIAQRDRDEATALRRTWEAKWGDTDTEALRVRQQADDQARTVIAHAQKEANRIIEELRKRQRQGETVKDHELVALRKELEGALPAERTRPNAARGRKQDILVGASVRVLSLGQKGEVLDKTSDGSVLTVQLGLLRMKVSVSDVELLQNKPAPVQDVPVRRSLTHATSLQLDVRGEIVDDALPRIDKYLDDAVVNGLARVIIIHGKGTGALRDGVRRYLASHPHVRAWLRGGAGEGGDGATVVELER